MNIYDFTVKAQDGSDEEIHSFCAGRYGITFPQFSKIDVNGEIAARFEPTESLDNVKTKVEEIL